MRALVITIFLYACDTWTLTAELQRRIKSIQFGCFQKILGISYKDRVTNEHMRKTIIKHIGPYEDLLATVKRRKLKWYGHVTRSDGLTKVMLQETLEGSRRRDGPKKSWIDNTAEWTGKSLAETQAIAHHQQEWRELTRKSTMTPPTAPRVAKGPRQSKARQGISYFHLNDLLHLIFLIHPQNMSVPAQPGLHSFQCDVSTLKTSGYGWLTISMRSSLSWSRSDQQTFQQLPFVIWRRTELSR